MYKTDVSLKREREITNMCGRDRERKCKQRRNQENICASKQPEDRLSSVLHGQPTNALKYFHKEESKIDPQ